MEEKKSFGQRVEAFFNGKGFYIVLFLCIAIIGVSTWAMLRRSGTDVDELSNYDISLDSSDEDDAISTTSEQYSKIPENENRIPANDSETEETEVLEEDIEEEIQEPDAEESLDEDDDKEDDLESIIPEDTEQYIETWSEEEPEAPETFVWPVNGAIETSHSVDTLVYNRTMGDWRVHEGIDIASELGTQVISIAGGTVESVYVDDYYGTTVVVAHNGGLSSVYSNLAETPTVYAGDSVMMGEVLGAVGVTAIAESADITHLHFGMTLDGEPVDPSDYLS